MGIRSCSKGIPIINATINKYLQKRVTKFKNNLPGRKWCSSFLERHPNISLRVSQNLSKSRANVTEESIRDWHAKVYAYLETNNIMEIVNDPSRILNMDETAIYLNPKSDKILTEKGDKGAYSVASNDEKECITTLIAGSAFGMMTPPMILHSYKRAIPTKVVQSTEADWGLGLTESGWMTAKTFYEYIANIFFKWLIQLNIRLPCILFVDGHTSHLTLPLSQFCKMNKIILVALHPNAAHILQPLDVAVFRPLKVAWKNCVKQWKFDNLGARIRKEDFAPKKAIENTDTERHLKSGFKVCGLYPFDANSIGYKRLVRHTTATNLVRPEEPLVLAERTETEHKKNNGHLRLLESFIEDDILSQYLVSDTTWNGNLEYSELYNVWKKIKLSCESNEEDDVVVYEDQWINELFSENITEVTISTSFGNDCTTSEDKVVENTEIAEEVSDPLQLPEPEMNKGQECDFIQNEFSPFKKAFIWPEDKVDGNQKKAIYPAVAFCSKWIEYQENKKKIKENLEKKKTERKIARISKIKKNMSTALNEINENKMLNYEVGSFVIFVYEGEYFPGAVVAVNIDDVLISSMAMSGPGKWKFPEKEDRLWYSKSDICEVIKNPIATNRSGRSYIVEELKTYLFKS